MYYLGFTHQEAYHLAIWKRSWFIQRIKEEFNRAAEANSQSSRAAHDNTPENRALTGKNRTRPPARLRRFT